jgi:phosphoserine phosphatase RsbU/P
LTPPVSRSAICRLGPGLWIRVLALCLGLFGAALALKAQTQVQPVVGSAARPYDATNLREPAGIGDIGLVQAGDDPAYARPDFDDSKWLPLDAKTTLHEYFPHYRPNVVWHRIHIKVDPGETQLALQTYAISRAFEVYVNGEKLMGSGQVEPYVPYTFYASHIERVPETQLRSGSLVIALRVHYSRSAWASVQPGSWAPRSLALGQESALRNQSLLKVIEENEANVLEALLGLGVGLVGLALFTAQRGQFEYLWIFLGGALQAAESVLLLNLQVHNLPADQMVVLYLLDLASNVTLLFILQSFLRKRFGWLLWLCAVTALFISEAASVVSSYGGLPVQDAYMFYIPWGIVVAAVLPLLLFKQLRRGDREAGILLIPLFFYCLAYYALFVATLLLRIRPLHSSGIRFQYFVFSSHLGVFLLTLNDLGNISLFISLALIMILRSTRISRQQALLEGEVAAAREVQQVILPEQVEPVPGFRVESVYLPAQQVGGDFFQVLPAGEGGLLLVMGDVAGKGLPAAMLVSVLVGAIRGAAEYTKSPAELLANLNERLIGRAHGGFSTALVAHIAADGAVTVVNAGHLPPFMDGVEVELPGALPLGIASGVSYETTRFSLPRGSRLTFYSDGVVEAQNQKGELFGFERGREISTQPAAAIVEAARQFGQQDDITVVTIERLAAAEVPAAIGVSQVLVPA